MARYCPLCMAKIEQGNICPFCVDGAAYIPKQHHLQPGSVLGEKYLIGKVLGEGGYGITYVGRDLALDMKVAIKEFFPKGMVSRNIMQTSMISILSPEYDEAFQVGKKNFISEAQMLAKMDKNSAVVAVRDYFDANNTVYIVMEYIEGLELTSIMKKSGKPFELPTLLTYLDPVFKALQELHSFGLIHRDISPDNIMIENGNARLIDFGCVGDLSNQAYAGTPSLKHSFSPIEQYEYRDIGPWTDVYSLASTVYYCLTGKLVPRATERVVYDELVPPSAMGVKIGKDQEQALLKALSVRRDQRYQSVAEFYQDLYAASPRQRTGAKKKKAGKPMLAVGIAAAVAVLALVAALLLIKPKYTVTFDLNGGELVSGELVQKVKKGESAVPPEAVNGRMALSWPDSYQNVTKDQTVKAEWSKVAMSRKELAAFVEERTVSITVKTRSGSEKTRTGFLIDENGTVVTDYYAIDTAETITVKTSDGKESSVKSVLKFSTKYDLAILETKLKNTPYFELADTTVKNGDEVYTYGAGSKPSSDVFLSGSVVSTNQHYGASKCFEVDSKTSEDNEGGPAVDVYGDLLGIISESYCSGFNYIIKTSMLNKLGEEQNLSLTEFMDWERDEESRCWTPRNNKDSYFWSYVRTYHVVTGRECAMCSSENEDSILYYDTGMENYFYEYTEREFQQYVDYLEDLGFVLKNSEEYDDGDKEYEYWEEKDQFYLAVYIFNTENSSTGSVVVFTPRVGLAFR